MGWTLDYNGHGEWGVREVRSETWLRSKDDAIAEAKRRHGENLAAKECELRLAKKKLARAKKLAACKVDVWEFPR